ncbi:MAG: hypothetical protein AAGD01_01040 [Acidobacteriota bacterium]
MKLDTSKTATTQQKVIALVLVLFAILMLWRSWPDSGQGSGGEAFVDARRSNERARGDRARNAARAPQEVNALHLAALEPQDGSFEVGRNLWAYYTPPPPPPPPPPPVVERRAAPPPPAGPPPPRGPRLPTVTVDYMGYFGPDSRRIAVFSDDDTVYNVREGAVLQEKFIVERIGLESVYLKYVDFQDLPAKQLKAGG